MILRNEFDYDIYIKDFLVCALWSSGDEFDGKSIYDFSTDALLHLSRIATMFLLCNDDEIMHFIDEVWNVDAGTVGHCLWLSMNGHGAGFFDYNSESLYADDLQAHARACKEINLYLGDDGKIYTESA